MATTEIEKLERRYAENPQGLTFAPLAEVHRKNGEPARALELLRAGLELHPNYIPASIVLGRCHWDLGDLPAAESAFSHVLRLDDENVIALKSLADINQRLERFTEAQRWLNRLISVDRSNEEARQQLARIEAARQEPSAPAVLPPEIAAAEAEPARAVSPAAPSAPEPRPEVAPTDLTGSIAEPEAVAGSQGSRDQSAPKSPVLNFLDTSEPGSQAPADPGAGLVEKNQSTDQPAAVEGLVSQEFVPPKDTTYRLHPELTQEFVTAGDVSDRLEVEIAEELELESSGAAEFRVPNAAEEFIDRASPVERAAPVAPMAPAPPPQPVATPTAPPEPARPSYSVRDTKGQSVAFFFQALLAARPPGGSGVSPAAPGGQHRLGEGSPGQAALTPNSAPGEKASSVPPTVPDGGPPQDAAVSFDDFFGDPAGGTSPLPTGRTEPGEDDLDQFQSWLQNLKR